MEHTWNTTEWDTWGESRKVLFKKQLNTHLGLWQWNYPEELETLVKDNTQRVWDYLCEHPELDELHTITDWWNDYDD